MSALYAVILNTHYVILNVVKNLSESANVRRLCYPADASLSLSMTKGRVVRLFVRFPYVLQQSNKRDERDPRDEREVSDNDR